MNSTTKTCPACHGHGAVPAAGGGTTTCPICAGDGEVEKKFDRRPYDLAFPDVTLPSASPYYNSTSIKQTAAADFEWWDIVISPANVNAKIRMEVNAEAYMNSSYPGNQNGILAVNWAGTAQLPYSRRYPWILKNGDQIALFIYGQDNTAPTVEVVFRGHLLIPRE